MERKLIIIRHGKSSWESVVDDVDRPLTERGVSNAYEMAARLLRGGQPPQAIFSSPANRALHTAIIMSRVWELDERQIHVCRDLYLADEDDILETVSTFPDALTSIAIFGHNPGFTAVANRYMRPQVDNVPTAGVVEVTLEVDSWNDIRNAKVMGAAFDYPKNLR